MRSSIAAVVFTLVLLAQNVFCQARSNKNCKASSCGKFHNISYPLRLTTDPQHCGNKVYELSCENNNLTILLPYKTSVKYHVLEIDYNSQTMRVVDPFYLLPNNSISSILQYPSILEDLMLTLIRCPEQIRRRDDLIWDVTPCINGGKEYWYVISSDNSVGSLEDKCSVQDMYTTSDWGILDTEAAINYNVYNLCSELSDALAYGFNVSWSYYYGVYRLSWLWFILGYIVEILMIIGAYRALLFLFGSPVVWIFLLYKWRRRHLSEDRNIEEFLRDNNNFMPIRYSYYEIKKITNKFKHKLGEGGYGCVYKGKLRSGITVAVKMLNGKSKANGQDFISEVSTIGRIHHFNVVQLIGFCVQGSNMALVYEFMPNGSLDKHLFSPKNDSTTSKNRDIETQSVSISNEQMFQISLGIARGIDYLHKGCQMQILHFDIKPHNILLNEKFVPKISDFGLAKLYPTDKNIVSLTAGRGTIGYIAPEICYKNIGNISYKADVYSFGMLLMEMASRRKNLNAYADQLSQIYYPSWVYDQLSKGKQIVLDNLNIEDDVDLIKKMTMVALWCIQFIPDKRPSMQKVIEMLEGDLDDIEMPPKPFLTPSDEARHNQDNEVETSIPTDLVLLGSTSNDSDSIALVINET